MKILSRLIFIAKYLLSKKIIFKTPSPKDIVVFDDESFHEIKNIFENRNYFLFATRKENLKKIYLTKEILIEMIKNFNGRIYLSYLISIIKVVNPKIVVTFIHNSLHFSDVARRLHKEISFIAVQNSSFIDPSRFKFLKKKRLINEDPSKKYFLPLFFCFGDYEKDYLNKNKIKVLEYKKLGSLRLSNFFEYCKKSKKILKKNKYDICVMPEVLSEHDVFGGKTVSDGLINIIKFSIKYAKKYKCKIVFPLKRDKKKQIDSFEYVNQAYKSQLSKSEYYFFINNCIKKKFFSHTSYFAVFQSKLVIDSSSTMLKEKLGYGGKVLGCNFTLGKLHEFPVKGICNLSGKYNNNFLAFEKRVNKILNMNINNYFKKIEKQKEYILNFDKKFSTKQKIILKMNKIIKNAK